MILMPIPAVQFHKFFKTHYWYLSLIKVQIGPNRCIGQVVMSHLVSLRLKLASFSVIIISHVSEDDTVFT